MPFLLRQGIVSAHKSQAKRFHSIFARFMTMRKKQLLARAIEIQNEN